MSMWILGVGNFEHTRELLKKLTGPKGGEKMALYCQVCADMKCQGPSNFEPARLKEGHRFCPEHGLRGEPLDKIIFNMPNVCKEGGGHLVPPGADFCPIHGTPIDHSLEITVRRWRELCQLPTIK